MITHIRNVTLIIIYGPSGVGKTTLIRRSGIVFVPSDTTRGPRPGEQEGVDFHFRRDFGKVIQEIKTGRFVQVAIGPSGDFFATKDTSYPHSGLATIPIAAAVIPIFRSLGFKKTITTFFTTQTYEEWIRRMSTHPATEEQRVRRLAEARRSFEFALRDEQTHFILNDDSEAAALQLKNLAEGKIDTERETKGRTAAKSILDRLSTYKL